MHSCKRSPGFEAHKEPHPQVPRSWDSKMKAGSIGSLNPYHRSLCSSPSEVCVVSIAALWFFRKIFQGAAILFIQIGKACQSAAIVRTALKREACEGGEGYFAQSLGFPRHPIKMKTAAGSGLVRERREPFIHISSSSLGKDIHPLHRVVVSLGNYV
jgi:hypothetical protein